MSITNTAKKKSYHSQIALRHTSEGSEPRAVCTSTRYTRVQDIRPQLPPAFSKKRAYSSAGGQLNISQFYFFPYYFHFFHSAGQDEEGIISRANGLGYFTSSSNSPKRRSRGTWLGARDLYVNSDTEFMQFGAKKLKAGICPADVTSASGWTQNPHQAASPTPLSACDGQGTEDAARRSCLKGLA